MDKNQKKQTMGLVRDTVWTTSHEEYRGENLGGYSNSLRNEKRVIGEECAEFLLFCGVVYGSSE